MFSIVHHKNVMRKTDITNNDVNKTLPVNFGVPLNPQSNDPNPTSSSDSPSSISRLDSISAASPTRLYRLRIGKGSPSVNIRVALGASPHSSPTVTEMQQQGLYSPQNSENSVDNSHSTENQLRTMTNHVGNQQYGTQSSSIAFNVSNQHSRNVNESHPIGNTAASGMVEQPLGLTPSYQNSLNARHNLMTGASGVQHVVLSNDKVVAVHMQPTNNKQSVKLPSYIRTESNPASPRSSICSQDSKSSSPRTSIVGPAYSSQPPPPYDYHRHGSPQSSIPTASPRSSVSGPSYDSKHSSPRTSITSSSGIFERHQLSPNLTNEEKTALILHLKNDDSLLTNVSEKRHTPAINQHRVGLSGLQRFNEPAPPPPYDPRSRVLGINIGDAQNRSRHHSPLTSPVAKSSNLTVPLLSKPNALKYDPEKSLEVLSKQLADDMQSSTTSRAVSSSSKPTVGDPNKVPPPPYHGPHHTEANGMQAHPQQACSNSSTPQMSPRPINNLQHYENLPQMSPAQNYQQRSPATSGPNVKAALPFEITPPQSKGPTNAQKKYNELTQKLEDQLSITDCDGEYFGEHLLLFFFRHEIFPTSEVILVEIPDPV